MIQRTSLLCTIPLTLAACGISGTINQELRQQETVVESQAVAQALAHSNVLIDNVAAVVPRAATRCEALPQSSCQLCFTEEPGSLTLALSTPNCALPAPSEGAAYDLKLNLADMTLAAAYTDKTATLSGSGKLNASANLPVFGSYDAVVSYQIKSGQVDLATSAVAMTMDLTYQSGKSSPVTLTVSVSGTSAAATGTVTGPNLNCKIQGSLQAAKITCE